MYHKKFFNLMMADKLNIPFKVPPAHGQDGQNINSLNSIDLHHFIMVPDTPDGEAVLFGTDSVSEGLKP